jgi:hypothetical protein
VLDLFRRLGSVQFDPNDVAGRTHDLMLHARASPARITQTGRPAS